MYAYELAFPFIFTLSVRYRPRPLYADPGILTVFGLGIGCNDLICAVLSMRSQQGRNTLHSGKDE